MQKSITSSSKRDAGDAESAQKGGTTEEYAANVPLEKEEPLVAA